VALINRVVQKNKIVFSCSTRQFVNDAVKPVNERIVRNMPEFLFDKLLGGATDDAGVIDDPGVSLQLVDVIKRYTAQKGKRDNQ